MPPTSNTSNAPEIDTHWRTAVKSFSWRCIATLSTLIISLLIQGDLGKALLVTGPDFLFKVRRPAFYFRNTPFSNTSSELFRTLLLLLSLPLLLSTHLSWRLSFRLFISTYFNSCLVSRVSRVFLFKIFLVKIFLFKIFLFKIFLFKIPV